MRGKRRRVVPVRDEMAAVRGIVAAEAQRFGARRLGTAQA